MIERALNRDRVIVVTGLIVVTVLAWAWIVPMSGDMYGPMSGPSSWMMTRVWDAPHIGLLFAMWAVMMVAMMLPSAAPTVLLYAAVVRRSIAAEPTARAYTFAAAYLVVWTTFAAIAVAIQRWLAGLTLLSPMMQISSRLGAATALALAGVYQMTPYKHACLSACQSPAAFIAKHWRNGVAGAFRMGLVHGLYCLGCCWALMLLLFVGGVMHLPTIALLTVLVLFEKALPLGRHARTFSRVTGAVLLVLALRQAM